MRKTESKEKPALLTFYSKMQVNFFFANLYIPVFGGRSLKLSREQRGVRENLLLMHTGGEEMGRRVAWDRNLKD